jgi:hypothetical protein
MVGLDGLFISKTQLLADSDSEVDSLERDLNRSAEQSRVPTCEDDGGRPDPSQYGRPFPCPCFRTTPEEMRSLKDAPHTEQGPEAPSCDGGWDDEDIS